MISANKKDLRNVELFTLSFLLVAAYFAFTQQNWEFVYYIVVVVLLAGLAIIVHSRVGFTKGLLWSLSLWALMHMVGGLMPVPTGWPIEGDKAVFYSWWIVPHLLKYDHLAHAYGFGIATWACWQAVRKITCCTKPTAGLLLISVLVGMGLGSFNEVVEFFAVLLIPQTNVGGYVNTGWDLVSNMVGAVIAAMLIWVFREK